MARAWRRGGPGAEHRVGRAGPCGSQRRQAFGLSEGGAPAQVFAGTPWLLRREQPAAGWMGQEIVRQPQGALVVGGAEGAVKSGCHT